MINRYRCTNKSISEYFSEYFIVTDDEFGEFVKYEDYLSEVGNPVYIVYRIYYDSATNTEYEILKVFRHREGAEAFIDGKNNDVTHYFIKKLEVENQDC